MFHSGPVNDLANKLTYSGDLRCGNEAVQNATLQAPSLAAASQQFTNQRWLLPVIQPDLLQSVVFLDTNLLSASFRCSTVDNATKSPLNRCEGAIALLTVEALFASGVESENVGIIAPYQSQVKFLKELALAYPKLEINTVDQYQGRDKGAILYTCTKSEPTESLQQGENTHENSILHDVRRLTVAVTRAKHKLVIIGDSQTLRQYPPFAKLLNALEVHQLIRLCDGTEGFNSHQIKANSRAFRL